jgi:hypothetical protein
VLCAAVAMAFIVLPGTVREVSAASPIRVYIFAGQSNMVGAATVSSQLPGVDPALTRPAPNVTFWGPTHDLRNRWGPLEAPTEIFQALSRHGFGPEISAAPRLAALHPGERIAIFKFAWNATNLHNQWNPRHRLLYPRLLDELRYSLAKLRADLGLSTKVAGIFWMQGESDSDTYAHAGAYGANLTNFIQALRRDLHTRYAPFIIGRIDDVRRYEPALRYSNVVRARQASVATHGRSVHLVSTDGLEHSPLSRIHLGTRGTIDLGRRFVQRGFGL